MNGSHELPLKPGLHEGVDGEIQNGGVYDYSVVERKRETLNPALSLSFLFIYFSIWIKFFVTCKEKQNQL